MPVDNELLMRAELKEMGGDFLEWYEKLSPADQATFKSLVFDQDPNASIFMARRIISLEHSIINLGQKV